MAVKITVGLEDDLYGPGDETIRLRIGGTEYEIHLSEKRHRVYRQACAVHRACPQGWPRTATPARADGSKPEAQRQYPSVVKRPGGQRRGHPRPASSSSAVPPPQAMIKPVSGRAEPIPRPDALGRNSRPTCAIGPISPAHAEIRAFGRPAVAQQGRSLVSRQSDSDDAASGTDEA
jgi:hypothetical protein